jgi:hypothetical protein
MKKFILRKKNVRIFEEKYNYKYQIANTKYTEIFVKEHIHNYYIHSFKDIKDEFDAIVVGSDQVWRMRYFKGAWLTKNSADAFLAFTRGWNIRRVAYAASFGLSTVEILPQELPECRACLKAFDAISVREESGVKVCKEILGRDDAKWVIDPTLLLDVEVYDAISSGYREYAKKSEGELVSYILDETQEKASLIRKIAKEKNLKISEIRTHEFKDSSFEDCARRPVEEWLQKFAHAGYIVTDSFHACIFSILNHKQFLVFANTGRGVERFESLLKIFGLEERMVFTPDGNKSLPYIDYRKVDAILAGKRKEAFTFLKEALG